MIEAWNKHGKLVAWIIVLLVCLIIYISTIWFGNDYFDTKWHWIIAWIGVFASFILISPKYFLTELNKS